jgi:hypothetical protein
MGEVVHGRAFPEIAEHVPDADRPGHQEPHVFDARRLAEMAQPPQHQPRVFAVRIQVGHLVDHHGKFVQQEHYLCFRNSGDRIEQFFAARLPAWPDLFLELEFQLMEFDLFHVGAKTLPRFLRYKAERGSDLREDIVARELHHQRR